MILKAPVVPGVGDVADAADASKLPLKERIQKRMKQIKENIAKQKDRIVSRWRKWRENRGDI